jgi:hypothetical protein
MGRSDAHHRAKKIGDGFRKGSPILRARLQSRQLPAHAGDARTDHKLVAGELEGEADQNRGEGGERQRAGGQLGASTPASLSKHAVRRRAG